MALYKHGTRQNKDGDKVACAKNCSSCTECNGCGEKDGKTCPKCRGRKVVVEKD